MQIKITKEEKQSKEKKRKEREKEIKEKLKLNKLYARWYSNVFSKEESIAVKYKE